MGNKHTRTGVCIFCGMKTPQVSFNNRPHVIPQSMGGVLVGVDVCDACNSYFGTPTDALSLYPMPCAIEECVKEIFNLSRHLLSQSNSEYCNKKLKSRFFDYFASTSTIKIRKTFRFNRKWQLNFPRQFKRGLCEMFLQSYHLSSGENANESKFDKIRRFARYNEGDTHLYYFVNRGIYFTTKDMNTPVFDFTDSQMKDIDNYGFYSIILNGHWFILEVIHHSEIKQHEYLQQVANRLNVGGFVFESIKEVIYITDIDFSLRSLYHEKPLC